MSRAKLSDLFRNNITLVLIVVVAGLTFLAWSNRFIQDDAFIAFRYAYNLANGKGLVWNDGYRVEGYTDFLWTLLMTIPHYLHRDPVSFSFVLGIISFIASLLLTYKLANLLLRSKQAALLTVILLGTNYTFSCYATGGLETQFQTALFLGSIYLLLNSLALRSWGKLTSLTLSGMLTLAVFTRPDSFILVVVVIPVALVSIFRLQLSRNQKILRASLLTFPFLVSVAALVFWKIYYYGNILPNTYYIRLGTVVSYQHGFNYLYTFLNSYWLFLFPILIICFSRDLLSRTNRLLLVPLALTVVWLAYIVYASGDFMEFRFLVPVLPFFFLLVAWLLFSQIRGWELRIGLIAVLLLGSLHHALTFERTEDVDSIRLLANHLAPEGENWKGIGKFLGETFGYHPEITIAVTAGGAIPYYSRLRTIDMLGVNDIWIARHGRIFSERPGHQRIAPFEYLIQSGTNLIVGHPILVPGSFSYYNFKSPFNLLDKLQASVNSLDELPTGAELLEMPIDSERKLIVVYLKKNPRIDEAIKEHGWVSHPLKDWD